METYQAVKEEIPGILRHGIGTGAALDAATLLFYAHGSSFKILLSGVADEFISTSDLLGDGSGMMVHRFASAGMALHHLVKDDSWLLVRADRRISIFFRDSLKILPEGELVLFKGEDINAAAFQDFKGIILIMSGSSMSPYDRSLLTRHASTACFKSGWGRLLGSYLESLDCKTLCVVTKDASGRNVIEQQIMAMMRRALLERLNGVRSWSKKDGDGSGVQSRGELLFKKICSWISENHSNPEMSSEFVAEHFGISSRYIQNLFSKYGKGYTFVSFLREKRMQRAWDMITGVEHAHQNISEICWNCGFSDPVYFGKTFRAYFGMTPGQARRQGLRDAIPLRHRENAASMY